MSSGQQSVAWRVASERTSTDEPSVVDGEESSANDFDTTAACAECGAQSFARSAASEWYCEACGAVHTGAEIEFSEPGWKPQEDRRTGPAVSVSRVSVGTRIGDGSGAGTGFWARFNNRLDHADETLRHGLRELRALATSLEATDSLVDQAAYLFRQVADDGLLVGHSIEAMAAACVHVTAREDYNPFPLKQIADASPVALDAIRSAVSKLVREYDRQVAPPLPSAFIARFASETSLPTAVRQRASELADAVIDDGAHVGQSPTGIAAAILYGAAREHGVEVTQSELADVAYVSVVTLSRHWQTVQTYIEDE
ncbi:transcription initiation factor TFIIB [Halomicrobium zhouii]|uniref:Transcription initiation factor TFIIB n=1 Tax=Halomicrobium zhouii TaxID=767519 RepID=A0A1I6L0I1_9EURY|nr:transcription initiation factor IIB family protein [Halomicrobium zhouii]SFR96975.1 transcription initiation factor TFIIB [Halomicrobium zhouii]